MLNKEYMQQGAGLIEVLASLIVVAVGVLGTLSMQNRSVQFNRGAMLDSKASILAADMIDRIRANPSQAMGYRIGLNDSPPVFTDCQQPEATCSVAQLAAFDVATWRKDIAASLPSGKGEVATLTGPGGTPLYVITVQYEDGRLEKASAGAQTGTGAPKQITFRTAI